MTGTWNLLRVTLNHKLEASVCSFKCVSHVGPSLVIAAWAENLLSTSFFKSSRAPMHAAGNKSSSNSIGAPTHHVHYPHASEAHTCMWKATMCVRCGAATFNVIQWEYRECWLCSMRMHYLAPASTLGQPSVLVIQFLTPFAGAKYLLLILGIIRCCGALTPFYTHVILSLRREKTRPLGSEGVSRAETCHRSQSPCCTQRNAFSFDVESPPTTPFKDNRTQRIVVAHIRDCHLCPGD